MLPRTAQIKMALLLTCHLILRIPETTPDSYPLPAPPQAEGEEEMVAQEEEDHHQEAQEEAQEDHLNYNLGYF